MKKLFSKIKNKKRGFAILFAVTMAAIVLAIALGVANIALKEVKFSTSAKATNDAFFAADVGTECALINDKSLSSVFKSGATTTTINCANQLVNINGTGSGPWDFKVNKLGSSANSCAIVTVTKVSVSPGVATTVNSKGYDLGGGGALNTCTKPNNSVERELETKYTTGASTPAVNLALATAGAIASQINTINGDAASVADRANDGNTNGTYCYNNDCGPNSVSVTDNNLNSWWQVDLGTDKTIQSINVFNRTDSWGQRLDGAHIFVAPDGDSTINSNFSYATAQSKGTNSGDGTWNEYIIDPANPTNLFNFSPPIVGRYVRVQLSVDRTSGIGNFLQLAEVQVMGND